MARSSSTTVVRHKPFCKLISSCCRKSKSPNRIYQMGGCASQPSRAPTPAPDPLAGLGRVQRKLHELGLHETLGEPVAPVANYRLSNSVIKLRTMLPTDDDEETENGVEMLYVSGQVPEKADESLVATGTIKEMGLDQAKACAKQCALNIISVLAKAVDTLDRVRLVKLTVFVACDGQFDEHSAVADGASDLFVDAFGAECGQHARTVIGNSSLPIAVCCEIEAIVEVMRHPK